MRISPIKGFSYRREKCIYSGNSTHICHFLHIALRSRRLGTFLICRHFRNVPKCRLRVCLRHPRPAASLRSLRTALENASRFLSSAPLRIRIPPLAHKKAPWAVMGLGRSVLMAGTEGFEPPTAGTKNRSSTVELRPNVWCCPKATRLVYLICEGIANAVE